MKLVDVEDITQRVSNDVLWELSLTDQLYRLIHAAGTRGAYSAQLTATFGIPPKRLAK